MAPTLVRHSGWPWVWLTEESPHTIICFANHERSALAAGPRSAAMGNARFPLEPSSRTKCS